MDVPQIIAGRFRIECEIGKGGMGTVYRATHLGLERPVAVKIIKPEFASDTDVADRFMREARTMARLRHPNAAMIFDAGNLPDGRYFIVMEYVEGTTLSEALARDGRFTPERAVHIAADICDVLGQAHKLGIVHRDLKPSNIMLNERGVCVLDFGVAKVVATSADATATHATTGSGIIIGTPRYMSPEQCLGLTVGARSDLYSLGVLLYEMIAGRPPFVDPLPSAVLVKQATLPPPPLPKLRTDVPRSLALAIHTLLAKRPEDRPANADAARRMLEKSIVKPPRAVPEQTPFAATVAALNTGRSVVFRALTPAATIAVLGLVLFVWGRNGQEARRPLLYDDAATNAAAAHRPASTAMALNKRRTLRQSPPLSLEGARRIVDSMSDGPISNVQIVRTKRDSAIVAVHGQHRAGTSHLFALERRGTRYRVTARAPLDVPGWSGANWTLENVDVDGDGYDEVLCTGMGDRGVASGCRLVLYVPRTRQAYSLRLEPSTDREKSLPHQRWSPNALTRSAILYRAVLQQRVRNLVAATNESE